MQITYDFILRTYYEILIMRFVQKLYFGYILSLIIFNKNAYKYHILKKRKGHVL